MGRKDRLRRAAAAFVISTCVVSVAAAEGVPRKWQIVRDADKLTDQESVTAIFPAEDGASALAIRCESDRSPRLSVQLLPDGVLLETQRDRTRLQLRFDDAEVVNDFWQVAKTGAVYPGERPQVQMMLHALYRASRLRVRLHPVSGQPIDLDFLLRETPAAVRQIGANCPMALRMIE